MYCPGCWPEGNEGGIRLPSMRTKVIDSRLQSNQTVRRRRQCGNCGLKFNTWEIPTCDDLRTRKTQKLLERIKGQAITILNILK
jgi:transcriptional regulator NrdR family protein